MQKNKIGVGIITCDRIDFFKKANSSLRRALKKHSDAEYICINDGKQSFNISGSCIKTEGYTGVAKAKNLALKHLIEKDCEHIFLMEDDIEIIDDNIFDAYINTSKATGLKHLNFGLHGNHNRDSKGNPTIIKTVNYGNGISIDLYPNVLGAFSYYHRNVLDDIGLMPTYYFNALEHVDHTYKASLKGYTSPWRYFADINNSSEYIKDIIPDHKQSKIRNNPKFQENFMKSLNVFIEKNGFSVVQGYGPAEKVIPIDNCIIKLKEIYGKQQ